MVRENLAGREMQVLALGNEAGSFWHEKGKGIWAGTWVQPDLQQAGLDSLKP